MAIQSDEFGYLFVEVPRTGSKAIGQGVLIPRLGGEMVGVAETRESAGDVHAPQHELVERGLLSQEHLQRLFVFGTVRNPFDSMVSLYEKMRNKYAPLLDDQSSWVHKQPRYRESMIVAQDAEFSEWLIFHLTRRKLFALHIAAVRPPRMLPSYFRGMQRIMRFESLQTDFNEVLEHLGVEQIEIPRMNLTGRSVDYRDYYTSRSRRLAERVFAEYGERFGYTF